MLVAEPELRTSPLHAEHERLGARFAPFGGWSMPLEYTGAGVLAEHTAVRTQVGVFDVSHLGKVRVRGSGAVALLDRCLTNDLGRIGAGQAQYTLLCTEDGGVVDDLIVYRHGDDDLLLVPNAANTAAVVQVLRGSAAGGAVEVVDQHTDLAVLAVQGTRSDEVLSTAGLPVGHDYMSFVPAELEGVGLTVCRTGYTGERGYELVVPARDAVAVWQRLREAGEPYGLQPAGLAARDTLRTEMGYPLHGHELGPEITPVQAGLGWAVGWDKPEFLGHRALREEKERGPARRLRGLLARGRGIPRPGMRVLADGRDVGEVTSGTFSPTLKSGIALALLDPAVTPDTEVEVQVRRRSEPFVVVKPPFVRPSTREH
uniref:glycine cleavage system aminomethyltransferase GcvT n=1 Tax=Desertihabitans brevis TaxID=2268447 RepID=UPI0026A50B84